MRKSALLACVGLLCGAFSAGSAQADTVSICTTFSTTTCPTGSLVGTVSDTSFDGINQDGSLGDIAFFFTDLNGSEPGTGGSSPEQEAEFLSNLLFGNTTTLTAGGTSLQSDQGQTGCTSSSNQDCTFNLSPDPYFVLKIDGGWAFFANFNTESTDFHYLAANPSAINGPGLSHVDTIVPGPVVGAGLPGLVMACGGLIALARRRRQKIA